MASVAMAAYLEVAASAPFPVWVDREPVGHLLVAREADDVDPAQRALSAATANGVAIHELDPPALRDAEPAISPHVVAGWLLEQGHRLDPAGLTVALALAAKGAGADIRHHLRVRGLIGEGDGVRGIVTDDGAIRADVVVVAAGPWSTSLLDPLGIRLPVTGARGWIVRTSGTREPLRHLIEHAGWRDAPGRRGAVEPPAAARLATDTVPRADVGAILHLQPDGTVLVGSSRQAWITPEPEDPSVPRRQLAAAIALVPCLAETQVLSTWWGLRPIAPDDRPLVGRLRDGLVVATGHGAEGVILGAGTATLVTSIVMGAAPPFDPAPFDPFRFERMSPGSSAPRG
jgi:glycine/D-amino acid oxidase-like deaminating enzyme